MFEASARSVAVVHDSIEEVHPHPRAASVEHVLTYLAGGRLHMDHGTPVEIPAGTVTVVPAGAPHRAIGGRDVELWQVRFRASSLQLDERQLLMSPFRAARRGAFPVVTIAEPRRPILVQRFKELALESRHATLEAPELCHSLLLLILGEVRRSMDHLGANRREGSLVGDALEFIQLHCFEAISLKDVAAAVHRTPAHVTTLVKEATGYSVGEWILFGRVAEAANRLARTDDRIEEIGRLVGWHDDTHFIRQFKKAYGITPAAWRRRNRTRKGIRP